MVKKTSRNIAKHASASTLKTVMKKKPPSRIQKETPVDPQPTTKNNILQSIQSDKWKQVYTQVRKDTAAVERGPTACNTIVLGRRLTRAALDLAFPVDCSVTKRAKRKAVRNRIKLWQQQQQQQEPRHQQSPGLQQDQHQVTTVTTTSVQFYPAEIGSLNSLIDLVNHPVNPARIYLHSNMVTIDTMKNNIVLPHHREHDEDSEDEDSFNFTEDDEMDNLSESICASSTDVHSNTRSGGVSDSDDITTTDNPTANNTTTNVGDMQPYLYLTMPTADFLDEFVMTHVDAIIAADHSHVKTFLAQIRNNKWKLILFRLVYPSLCSLQNGFATKYGTVIDISRMNYPTQQQVQYNHKLVPPIDDTLTPDIGTVVVRIFYQFKPNISDNVLDLSQEMRTIQKDLVNIGGLVPYDLLKNIHISIDNLTPELIKNYIGTQPDSDCLGVSYTIQRRYLANWFIEHELAESQRYIDRDFTTANIEKLLENSHNVLSKITLR